MVHFADIVDGKAQPSVGYTDGVAGSVRTGKTGRIPNG